MPRIFFFSAGKKKIGEIVLELSVDWLFLTLAILRLVLVNLSKEY